MTQSELPIERVREYVQQLSVEARSRLLVELERLHLSGDDIAGSEALLGELRAEFRKSGDQSHDRVKNPSRYFFHPLEPLLVNCSPERANAGQISRGSLAAIWEWIGHCLLPAMARDYEAKMKPVVIAGHLREAEEIAAAFQSKIVKSLEGILASPSAVERVRGELAAYTSSRASFDDLTKMLTVLKMRDVLALFSAGLPREIASFDGAAFAKVRHLLDTFVAQHPEAMPFALTLIAKRLKMPWQLIHLATKAVGSKRVADISTAPYAISVVMAMDHIDEKRMALCTALKGNHIQTAKEILTSIYATEDALRARIDLRQKSHWSSKLNDIMKVVAIDLDAEVHKLPGNLHHVLASRTLHHHDTARERLTELARGAVSSGAAYCRNVFGLSPKLPG